jgi:PAB-dependent poly(A)-specific ribonuclease subunit 3
MDPNWAETGDRYVLKLFRDYVFHQVDSEGNPVLDIGHVVKALNKVDVGVQERVLLTSRDEKSCLIVTYEDLKRCIILSLQDLRNRKQKT